MKLRSALLAATVLAAPVAANAQAVSGLYIGAGAGANFMQNETVNSVRYPNLRAGTLVPPFGNATIDLSTGFVGVASVGYGLGNGLRLEVEGGYRTNDFGSVHGVGGPVRSHGREEKYSGMVNVLYDIDPALLGGFALPFPVNPYVGVGAGYAWVQDKNASFGGYGAQKNFLYSTNSGDGNFAYQAIIGAAFPVGAVPGLSVTAEYRFFGVLDGRSNDAQYFAPGIATRATVKFNDDYNHSVMLGLRYAFNAAPPPVAAPITPTARNEAARTYLVFFDWDRADLTDRARQIVAEAAQATTRVQVTRIMVSGYTDTSGTARYNQGLSVRRAQNVAAELVRRGVPRAAITTQGFGETHPLVATGQGVREPQNRRVEIVLQ